MERVNTLWGSTCWAVDMWNNLHLYFSLTFNAAFVLFSPCTWRLISFQMCVDAIRQNRILKNFWISNSAFCKIVFWLFSCSHMRFYVHASVLSFFFFPSSVIIYLLFKHMHTLPISEEFLTELYRVEDNVAVILKLCYSILVIVRA